MVMVVVMAAMAVMVDDDGWRQWRWRQLLVVMINGFGASRLLLGWLELVAWAGLLERKLLVGLFDLFRRGQLPLRQAQNLIQWTVAIQTRLLAKELGPLVTFTLLLLLVSECEREG